MQFYISLSNTPKASSLVGNWSFEVMVKWVRLDSLSWMKWKWLLQIRFWGTHGPSHTVWKAGSTFYQLQVVLQLPLFLYAAGWDTPTHDFVILWLDYYNMVYIRLPFKAKNCIWFKMWQPNYFQGLPNGNMYFLFWNSCVGCQFVSVSSSAMTFKSIYSLGSTHLKPTFPIYSQLWWSGYHLLSGALSGWENHMWERLKPFLSTCHDLDLDHTHTSDLGLYIQESRNHICLKVFRNNGPRNNILHSYGLSV